MATTQLLQGRLYGKNNGNDYWSGSSISTGYVLDVPWRVVHQVMDEKGLTWDEAMDIKWYVDGVTPLYPGVAWSRMYPDNAYDENGVSRDDFFEDKRLDAVPTEFRQ